MKWRVQNSVCLAAIVCGSRLLFAADGQLRIQYEPDNVQLRVQGSTNDEWRFETSWDLRRWTNAPALGTAFSDRVIRSAAPAGPLGSAAQFFRSVKTEGLFDSQVLRTISLTFTQSNWPTLLANGRTTGSNTLGTLVLDNGLTNFGVGVRYKGNTSYTMGGTKKSLNIELNYTNSEGRLMGYKTINLNNAAGDETILREPLYFNAMRQYAPSPKGSLVKLNINGAYWGVYSFVQQENSDLIKEWFPSSDGDRWRAPNVGGGTGGGGGRPGGGAGGGFSSALSALSYLGANVASYKSNYELKTDNSTNAWERLVHAIDVLNNTPSAELRDKVEDVLAVDRWLWFLAIENVFADDDSYFNKGADYGFYFEPESGRIHPVEHDGNESFTAGDVQLSPVQGATGTNRPVLYRLLPLPDLRQRYLAHIRTVLEEFYNPAVMNPLIDRYRDLSIADVIADTKKSYTMAAYTNDLNSLKTFVAQRYAFLTNHAELRPPPPKIASVNLPEYPPTPRDIPMLTAQVLPNGNNGIDSVWLYYRPKSYGRFAAVQMFDDGAHGDGLPGDGVYGAPTTNYPAGTKVRCYVEARSANTAKAASFAPARAEQETYSYRVGVATAANTPIIINELMASNTKTFADPQGEFDDWIELRNLTDRPVDLSGLFLSDDPDKPRKWTFPAGTTIPANGYLIVWADEDAKATSGLHANFKLSAIGEQVLLVARDENQNELLDLVTFGALEADRSFGRNFDDPSALEIMSPTPGAANLSQ